MQNSLKKSMHKNWLRRAWLQARVIPRTHIQGPTAGLLATLLGSHKHAAAYLPHWGLFMKLPPGKFVRRPGR